MSNPVEGNTRVEGKWKNSLKKKQKIKALFLYYRTEYTCPPYRIEVEFGQSHQNISISKTSENYRYTIGRLLSRYWISIGELNKKLWDVQENQYKEGWFSNESNSKYQ